jgi:hypothetical protein
MHLRLMLSMFSLSVSFVVSPDMEMIPIIAAAPAIDATSALVAAIALTSGGISGISGAAN